MPASVLVIDEYPVIREGVAHALRQAGFVVLTASPAAASEACQTARPRVLVIEPQLASGDGIALSNRLSEEKANRLPVVVFSASSSPTLIARAAIHGAADYILKSRPVEDLVEAVRWCATGQRGTRDTLIAQMRKWLAGPVTPEPHLPDLTLREQQVLRHLALGLGNREIGESLSVSIETIKELVQSLLRKLDVEDRTAAAMKAGKFGPA